MHDARLQGDYVVLNGTRIGQVTLKGDEWEAFVFPDGDTEAGKRVTPLYNTLDDAITEVQERFEEIVRTIRTKIDIIDNETFAVVHTVEVKAPFGSSTYERVFRGLMRKTDLDRFFLRETPPEGGE